MAGSTLSAELQRTWSEHMSEVRAAEAQRAQQQTLTASLALLAAGAALAQAYQPPVVYQPLLLPSRPVQTTCMRMGNIVNCQSY
jgi:hypothetical protein